MAFKVQVGPPQIAIHQGQTVLVTDLDGTITWPSERVATLPHCGPSLRTVTPCPRGAERLRSAELIAREIEAWRVNSADVVRISHELCLPAFKHDPCRPYAWPRQR